MLTRTGDEDVSINCAKAITGWHSAGNRQKRTLKIMHTFKDIKTYARIMQINGKRSMTNVEDLLILERFMTRIGKCA